MREVRWHPSTESDLRRISTRRRAKIKVLTEVYSSQVPPAGSIKRLDLGEPWGVIEQLSVEEYRVLYDEHDDDDGPFVEVVLVFRKPAHVDTLPALRAWLGKSFEGKRRKR